MRNTKKLVSILCLSLMMVLAFAFSGCGDKGMDPDTAISITQNTVNETYGYTYGDALAYYVGDINWSFSFEDKINSVIVTGHDADGVALEFCFVVDETSASIAYVCINDEMLSDADMASFITTVFDVYKNSIVPPEEVPAEEAPAEETPAQTDNPGSSSKGSQEGRGDYIPAENYDVPDDELEANDYNFSDPPEDDYYDYSYDDEGWGDYFE